MKHRNSYKLRTKQIIRIFRQQLKIYRFLLLLVKIVPTIMKLQEIVIMVIYFFQLI